jgi:cytochrome c oxidase accessory protein FixG
MSSRKKRTFRYWRWLAAWAQALLVIGIPFVKIHGQSAVRFDVPSLKLYFFGSVIWISEAYFFLLIFLLFFVGIMLFTVLFGRIWCGWMCPQMIFSDIARYIERVSSWFSRHVILKLVLFQLLLLLFSSFVSASLIWYFVSPYDMVADIRLLSMGPWTFWSWFLFAALIYLDIGYVRQKFCGSICPYARFQSAFFDEKTLTIAFDQEQADQCQGCEACVRACPADIDIRQGLQVECINCAGCIDACGAMMDARNRGPLIRYMTGTIENQGHRSRVVGLAVLFAVLAVLFAYQIHTRMPFNFWMFRDDSQPIEQTKKTGDAINVYSLIVENRSLEPGKYALSISGIEDAEIHMSRNPVILPPNSTIRIKVYVQVKRKSLNSRITPLRFILKDAASPEIRKEQDASFIYPDRTDRGGGSFCPHPCDDVSRYSALSC